MAEEEGTPVATVTAPDATPKAEDKWTGKSPEELVSMLKNQEVMISKQGNDIGDLRNEIVRSREEQRLALEQDRRQREYVQPQYPPQQPSYQPPDESRFNFEKPVASVYGLVNERLQAELDVRDTAKQQYDRQMNWEQALVAYARGRDKVFSKKDPLYEGIEPEVANLVQQTYMAGLDQRTMRSKTPIEDLREEGMWKTAAQFIRLQREEYDKLVKPKTQPVSAPFGEVSAQVKDFGGGGTMPDFDEGADAMIRNLGAAAGIKNREQAAEALRGGKEKK